MVRFAILRMLLAIPVLFVVSVLAFFMAENAPGDPVASLISVEQRRAASNVSYTSWLKSYERQAVRLGVDKPAFYFTIQPSGWPDTLYRITYKAERLAAASLLRKRGKWSEVQEYQRALRNVASMKPVAGGGGEEETINDARYLLITPESDRVNFIWSEINDRMPELSADMRAELARAQAARQSLLSDNSLMHGVFPNVSWQGFDNRYHHWLTSILVGDYGISIIDGRPVGAKIREAVGWTLRINVTAILLAFLISIPLGLYLGRREGSMIDRVVSSTLFIFFAIPSFWLATLLIVFFTTPEYAQWMDLFPSSGLGNYYFASGGRKMWIAVSSLFLPVLCLLLGALAYLTRQMRGNVIRESGKDYVRMARAKGLTDRAVYRRHILRNALFPILTLVGASIPASISGSVIIEVIFGIPGMGQLLYQSILAQDWAVVFIMIVLAAVLTVAGYILSDLLYRIFDPRLRTQRSLS